MKTIEIKHNYYKMKHLNIPVFVLILISLLSCSRDDLTLINSSSTTLNFEGEGGQKDISFTDGDWKITKVINQDNNQNIFGSIYLSDGDLIQENEILKLDSLGSLEAIWSDKGFIINRETVTSIVVHVKENFTKESFGFIIFLESGNESKQIVVNQKPSQGYEIESIKYTIENNDNDSLFVQERETYSFDINSSLQQTFSLDPFVNTFELSQFKSNEDAAFPWKGADAVMVKVPTQIIDDQIFTNSETSLYSNELTQKDSKFKGQVEEVPLPQGQSKLTVEIEYRKRKVSYTLHLINKRTKEDKIVTGKWIETAPTGNYEIKWQ